MPDHQPSDEKKSSGLIYDTNPGQKTTVVWNDAVGGLGKRRVIGAAAGSGDVVAVGGARHVSNIIEKIYRPGPRSAWLNAEAEPAPSPMKAQAAAAALMSCWVAPTLAAEIWHISLSELMGRIASGEIPVRDEDGFLFVDVAPYGPRVERPNRPPEERPPTFTPIEMDGEDEELIEDEPTVLLTDEEASVLLLPSKDEAEMGPIDDTASTNLGDWRAARRQAARTRVPPPPPRRLSA